MGGSSFSTALGPLLIFDAPPSAAAELVAWYGGPLDALYEFALYPTGSPEYLYFVHNVYPPGPPSEIRRTTSLLAIADPVHPHVLDPVEELAELRDFTLLGRRGLLTTWSDALQVLDLSDPAVPTVVAEIELASFLVGTDYDNLTGSPHAYALSMQSTGGFTDRVYTTTLQVINVSDPESPARVGSLEVPGYRDQAVSSENVLLLGGRGNLDIVDLSDPRQPNSIGTVPVDVEGDTVYDLAVHASKLLVATWDALLVYDISEPEQPRLVGTRPGRCSQIVPLDERHVLTAGDQLAVLDIAVAGDPVAVAVLDSPDYVPPHDPHESDVDFDFVARSGDYVFGQLSLRDSPQGLVVVRLRGPLTR
jgi:hypothetical protein